MKYPENTSRLSLTSLHNAARRGDSASLQRLIATIDPLAAEKIAAVLRDGDSRGACISSPRTAAAPKNKVKGKGAGRTTSKLVHSQGKSGGKKKKAPCRLELLLRKQDSKRRTALYVACASGNTEIADALLTVGASLDGHGAWQRTPLHIAAFEGHTSAMRRLLGAGADPWALNDRGQTPSEVSQMFNANREALGLLEEAAIMRREVSTGTEGLIGTTFVHDDGQVGAVVDAAERWTFTLEVELDGWKMGNGSGAKLYLPVSGERLNTRAPPSSAGTVDTMNGDHTPSGSRSNPRNLTEPIPWLANTVQRMRLESEDLVRVTADSLIGARVSRRTPLGGGRVTAVRNVKIRCDLRTAASSTRAGPTTATATGRKRERRANATLSETRSEEPDLCDRGESLGMPMQEAQSCRSWCTASSDDDVGLKVLEVSLAAGLGAVGHHGDRERCQGEDGSKATSSCATPRGPENAVHGHRQVGPSGECSTRRCLSTRLVQVASNHGVPRRQLEQRPPSEDSCANDGDTDDESGTPDDWSVGTESAAEFDACVATTVNERTREGFGSQRAGTEIRSTNGRGALSQDIGLRTRRFSFLDNLVPLAALEGVLDCNHLPPSAMAPQSRARRRQLLSHWNTRMSVSMAAGGGASAAPTPYQRHRAHQYDTLQHSSGGYSMSPSPASTHSVLEVDDLSVRGARDREGDDDLLGIVGLEEKIEREECSAERMDGKRIGVEATRKALREALVLWSGKADILQ
ncbi:unnamed protein product, partial [Ectocarpus sp. 13 AM-2016]